MAKLNIAFAETVAQDQFGKPLPVQTVPPNDTMWPVTIDIPGASAVFPIRTRWLRLQCDVRCEFWVGAFPASWPGSGGLIMEAGQTEMFGIDEDAFPKADELHLMVRVPS